MSLKNNGEKRATEQGRMMIQTWHSDRDFKKEEVV
jgi:hypothetical protein